MLEPGGPQGLPQEGHSEAGAITPTEPGSDRSTAVACAIEVEPAEAERRRRVVDEGDPSVQGHRQELLGHPVAARGPHGELLLPYPGELGPARCR